MWADRAQTIQRILAAEMIASPLFMCWLDDQNESGADVFLGMNPIKDHSHSRTKENIREIRHVYLDLDEGAIESLRTIRTSGDVPSPNFVRDTSPEKHQVIWRVASVRTDSFLWMKCGDCSLLQKNLFVRSYWSPL